MQQSPDGRMCQMAQGDTKVACESEAIGHVHLQEFGEPEVILWVCRPHFDWFITTAYEHEFSSEGE